MLFHSPFHYNWPFSKMASDQGKTRKLGVCRLSLSIYYIYPHSLPFLFFSTFHNFWPNWISQCCHFWHFSSNCQQCHTPQFPVSPRAEAILEKSLLLNAFAFQFHLDKFVLHSHAIDRKNECYLCHLNAEYTAAWLLLY